MIELAKQFFRFFLVGCGSAVGHYGLLILLASGFGVDAVIATIPASILGAVINYFLNYRFTFNSDKRHRDIVSKFAFIAIVGLALNAFFMWVGIDLLHWDNLIVQVVAAYTPIRINLRYSYLIVQAITTVLVMVWGFIGNRFWTFRDGDANS